MAERQRKPKTQNVTLRLSPEEMTFLKREHRPTIIEQFRADKRLIEQLELFLKNGYGAEPFGRIFQMAKGEIIEETQPQEGKE